MRAPGRPLSLLIVILASLVVAGCAGGRGGAGGRVLAVGAESQYADVIAAVGGDAVSVTAIMDNPSVDPHSFEASPSVANAISQARLVVQNGLGYDTFMNHVEAAAPNPARRVIDVSRLLGLPSGTANPHLWYGPNTMLDLAAHVDAILSGLRPKRAAYFHANEVRFDRSLGPWFRELFKIAHRFRGARVATTEPVADDLLSAAGLTNAAPFPLQADVMNGIDPAPQQISLVESLLSRRRVRVFVVNQQVTDSLTERFRALARRHGIPVVGVYETLPRGLDYAHWMLAETEALKRALATGSSTGTR